MMKTIAEDDMLVNRLGTCLVLLILLLACGCSLSGVRTDRGAELLAKDYVAMSDKELQTYYNQLSDQIAKTQRAAAASRETGAAGSTREREGVSGDVPKQTVAEELRDRWNDVRTELRRRGLRQ